MTRKNGQAVSALRGVGLEVSEALYRVGDFVRDWADGAEVEAVELVERLACGAVDALALAQRCTPDLVTREVFAAAIAVVGALPGGPGVQPELSGAVRAEWERDTDLARMTRAG